METRSEEFTGLATDSYCVIKFSMSAVPPQPGSRLANALASASPEPRKNLKKRSLSQKVSIF